MSNHATYSPSAASRWMECPGSVPLSADIHATGSEHNIYTASGSVIHALGEMLLRAVFLDKEDYRPLLDHALTEKWGYYCDLPDEFAIMDITEDMVTQAEQYLYHVRSLVE